MTPDAATAVWAAARSRLQAYDGFDIWVASMTLRGVAGGEQLVFAAPAVACSWINDRWRAALDEALGVPWRLEPMWAPGEAQRADSSLARKGAA